MTTELRVMTYNILQGGRRGQPVYDAVRTAVPDVLLVNESPKTPVLWRRRSRRFSERCGLRFVAGGRPAGSNLVAVAPEVGVVSVHAERLRQPLGAPRRGVVATQLRVQGRLLGVVSCHLSLDADRRLAEAARVVELAARLRGPVVGAGDHNEGPDGPCWRLLERSGYVDHGSSRWRTFPADRPERRIDALLVRGDVEVFHHGDPGVDPALLAAASDHRPVLARIALDGTA
jgi:endonuclease/exonuclease/phosphatase family metal-dependent hydrolase